MINITSAHPSYVENNFSAYIYFDTIDWRIMMDDSQIEGSFQTPNDAKEFCEALVKERIRRYLPAGKTGC